jgi:hypothetical protein
MHIVNSADMLCEITAAMQKEESVYTRKAFVTLPRQQRIGILANLLAMELLNDGQDISTYSPHFPIDLDVRMYNHITDKLTIDNILTGMTLDVPAHSILTKMAEVQAQKLTNE